MSRRARSAAPRRPWLRRLVRGLQIAIAVPLVALVAVLGYLHTGAGKERIRQRVEARLGERVNGTVALGGLDFTLFGDLRVTGLSIRDAAGNEAIALDELHIAPAWGDLLRGRAIALDTLALHGLRVRIVKDAAGGSNLRGLFKPSEGAPAKPLDKRVELRSITLDRIEVKILSPDGSELCVHDVSLTGSVDAQPARRDVEVALALGLGVALDRPASEGAGRLALRIDDLKTGLKVALGGGKGKLTLLPVSARVALSRGTTPEHAFPFAWDGAAIDVGDGDLGASFEKLAADAVSLGSISLHAEVGDAGLAGAPKGDVLGVHLDAAKLNAFVGQPLLKSDADLEAHLAGEPSRPTVNAVLRSGGAKLTVEAALDVHDAAHPAHDATVRLEGIDTAALIDGARGVKPVKVGSLAVHATGSGMRADALDTHADIEAHGIEVAGVSLDARGRAALKPDRIELESLTVDALDQRVHVAGSFDRAAKKVDLDVSLDGDVGSAVKKAREAKLPVTVNLPAGDVRLPEDDLHVHVVGPLAGPLTASAKFAHLELFGGRATLDASAGIVRGDEAKGEKKISVTGFDAELSLEGVLLSRLLALRGKRIPPELGLDAALAVRVSAHGTPEEPRVTLAVSADEFRKDGGPRARLDLNAVVDPQSAALDVGLRRVGAHVPLLTVHGALPLVLHGDAKGLDPARDLDLRVSAPRVRLERLLELVPPALLAERHVPPALAAGELELGARVTGTAAHPKGSAHLEFLAALLADAAEPASQPSAASGGASLRQKVALDAELRPTAAGAELAADVGVALDEARPPLVTGHVDANLPGALRSAGERASFAAHVAVHKTALAELPDLAKLARVRALGGTLAATVDLAGTRHDLTGKVTLDAAGLTPNDKGPFDAGATVTLTPDATALDVRAALAGTTLATLAGTLGVAGKGLVDRAKLGLDPSLDLALDVPARPLASLGALAPALAKAPGTLGGHIAIGGHAKLPSVHGGLNVSDVPMWSGQASGAGLALSLDDHGARARIGLGAVDADQAPVVVEAKVGRLAVAAFALGGALAIQTAARADHVDIKRLVPAFAVAGRDLDPKGELDWNMDGHVDLARKDGKLAFAGGGLDGTLSLSGSLPIPGTARSWHDIALALSAAGGKLTLSKLELHETDREVQDRKLAMHGVVEIPDFRPRSASVTLEADRWLLFGKSLGHADAPRGTVTLTARASAELEGAVKKVKVDVDQLAVLIPDRFDKAHQPEDLHVGDVFFDGDGVPLGKLRAPLPSPSPQAAEGGEKVAPAAAAEPTGLDVDIHIAKGARAMQAPIDLTTGGDLHVASRGGARTVRGQLVMTGGELSLGGKMHPLTEGSLAFDDAHPSGYLDLTFAKQLPPAALREVSEASAGEAIRIHMTGPISDRKTVLSGAGSPGALWDLLAMHNEGRPRAVTDADLPHSVTVDFPRHEGLLVLSFISVNLPHLLFLDRVAAWADAYDAPKRYGHLEHFEGDRYFAGGSGRFRASKRPVALGQSEAELEIDYLFFNRPRVLFGFGATGGSRGGGGPALVFEWSSKE